MKIQQLSIRSHHQNLPKIMNFLKIMQSQQKLKVFNNSNTPKEVSVCDFYTSYKSNLYWNDQNNKRFKGLNFKRSKDFICDLLGLSCSFRCPTSLWGPQPVPNFSSCILKLSNIQNSQSTNISSHLNH